MIEKTAVVLGLALSIAGAAPAFAVPVRDISPGALYLRARAAEIAGDAQAASRDLGAVLAREPSSTVIAQRAYTQALAAGDTALALRAARLLDRGGALRPDGRLLFVAEAIRQRDWKAALAAIDRVEQERLFGFMTPMLRAWVAVGSRSGDPLASLAAANGLTLAAPYLAEQRGLLLIATGQVEEGVATLRGNDPAGLLKKSLRLRLIVADALARTGQKERALAVLDGSDPALAIGRERIAAGRRIPAPLDGPAEGVATLLIRVATDFGQQKLTPVSFTLSRLATLLAPEDAAGWLVVGDTLGSMQRPEAALAALSHVTPDDPLAPATASLRVALLSQIGKKEEALAEARKETARDDAGPTAWSRLGDLYLMLERPSEAAAAYAKAIALVQAAGAPTDALWPLWLQRGSALELAGDWPGARASLQQALALAPDQALVLNQLGYSEIEHHEDVAAASGLIERASRLRPDDPAITDSLGWVYFLRGDVARAVPLLEKAAAADPTEPTISEHLGDAYWRLGREWEARYAWRAALVIAEDKDRARISGKIDRGLGPATAKP